MSLTTYPISLPATPGIVTNTIKKMTVVAVASSPFSLTMQTQTWPGQMWLSDLVLPKMVRANGEKWAAAFASLNGREGSLLIGDTANKVPLGSGTATALISATPAINNGGFETAGTGGADVFGSWTETIAGGSSAISRDLSVFRTGTAACKFQVDSSGNQVNISQAIFSVGLRYHVTFWARGTGSTVLNVYDGATIQAAPSPPAAWTFYDYTFISTGTTFLLSTFTPSGTIYIDDVTVSCLSTYGGIVNGGGQSGYSLNTRGWLANQTGILKAGDWLQLGTGYNSRLYKSIFDANSDASGNATLTVWPQLRSSPADGDAVKVTQAQGRFMLAKEPEYSIGPDHIYTFSTISLVEDLRP